ncbi:amino acid ABC transporter membrane protein (PAAT family) [Arthrobacter sp. SLBN-100]|uniref:amino acid ABC transporter permease n=1 Tax=Arthrobacter sp. SLBN-100 TaxID=2768450 RepID=UPI00115256DA|nr:amino acid ABC transporter permease [Arthrobacter sp. SLBN-100]TQJ68143.1 amino acid ABC transporter membrane protein (PAAT family) [Arthrobacter sp. SLBN-100]
MEILDRIFRTFFDWESLIGVLPTMLQYAVWNTLLLALCASVLGVILGMALALMSMSNKIWLKWPARTFINVFRGLPAVLTILVIGQGLSPLGLELWGPNPYPLGILALGLISAAYIGEIFRSGIESVERGQFEASRALGMSHSSAMLKVVVPQGIRRVLPALVNQFISNIKDSSLVYFLGLLTNQRELFRVGQDEAITTGNLSPLVTSGIMYLIITIPLTFLVGRIDRRLKDGKKVSVPVEDADTFDKYADLVLTTTAKESK